MTINELIQALQKLEHPDEPMQIKIERNEGTLVIFPHETLLVAPLFILKDTHKGICLFVEYPCSEDVTP